MNQDQINSLIRSLLKIAGTALAAHGLSTAASIVNSQDFVGAVLVGVGLIWSHFDNSNTPTGSSGTGKSGTATSLLVLCLLPALLLGSGCANVNQNAFTAELAAASTSDAAMRGYAAYWNQAIQNPAAYNRTTNGLVAERATVENDSIQIGASIALVESLRESYQTNSAVKPQLQAAVTSLAQNAGNIVSYVTGLFASTNASLTTTNN
jgi:hypothetical protein